ncbi:MAG: nicotinate (nicotinamide) nucleotide adenylyltransferase [Bacteroidetes bacterium]|nr:nicotinate (nicotinamide) nucleotide adenylyltransferase [Bacteroidota bacterium]
MKPTGLFFGSFNPIHTGHLILANYLVSFGDLEEVWFVISPQNPFKQKESLLADHHRYYMVTLAVEDNARFRASDIEFKMTRPSFTIDTLTYLKEKYPGRNFILLMGSDQLPSFHRWKNFERILEYHQVYVYPRPRGDSGEFAGHPNVKRFDAPLLDISSTFIREAVKNKKDVRYLLPDKVYQHILDMHFYEK